MRNLLSSLFFILIFVALGAMAFAAAPRGQETAQPVARQIETAAQPVSQENEPAAPDASGAGFNWITLPLQATDTLTNASDLAADIEAQSGQTVSTVEEWSGAGQGFGSSYSSGLPFTDFALTTGHAYRVSVTGGSEFTWTIVGDVPDPSLFTYTLYETPDTDFTWIMIPLDKSEIDANNDNMMMASELADDIETDSTGGVAVETIEQWSAAGQGFGSTYSRGLPFTDFEVKLGYPYRVAVDITSGSTVDWPVR